MWYPTGYTDEFEGVDGKVDTRHRMQRLIDRIGQLAPEDRDLLVLIAWEGFSNQDAAAVLGIPARTVGSRAPEQEKIEIGRAARIYF